MIQAHVNTHLQVVQFSRISQNLPMSMAAPTLIEKKNLGHKLKPIH
ncbi:MAG: hypothetical protein ACR2MS_03250 [Weeksellaceae bacterium]